MIALISLILVLVGCANWLTIGLLQFDFVAGLFGSQSNIFSRIVYVVVGIAAIIITANLIQNKGRIVFNFKKMQFKKVGQKPALTHTEVGLDMGEKNYDYKLVNHNSTETATDNSLQDIHKRLQDKHNSIK